MNIDKFNKVVRVARLLFVFYLVVLLYFLFLCDSLGREPSADYRYNLVPFKEIMRYIKYSNYFSKGLFYLNLIGNIVCLIPLGLFFPVILCGRAGFIRTLCLSYLFSCLVEGIQLLLKVGSFDVDDIILNTIGGVIGYIIYRLFIKSWFLSLKGNKQKDLSNEE